MSYAWTLGLRYLRSKKRAFISVGTVFAILGVALGVTALATVMSVTGGFQKQFRDKVLGVNAHVLVLKRTPEFLEYRKTMERAAKVPGVTGVAPFVINPMLVTAGDRTATGVLMKGVDPERVGVVLDLPKHVVEGSLDGLRRAGAKPPAPPKGLLGYDGLVDERGLPLGAPAGSGSSLAPSPTAPLASAASSAAAAPPDSSAPPRAPSASEGSAPAPSPTGAGAASDGAPPSDPLFRLMEERLAAKQKENEEAAKSEADLDTAAAAASARVATTAPGGTPPPSGSIEPTGGYAGELPTDEDESKAVDAIAKAEQMSVADKDLPGVALGRTLAKSLGVELGSRIRITSPAVGFSFSGSSRAPVAKQFKVVAVFEAGFDQYDSKLVYVDLYEAQAFYDQGDSVTGVEMRVADIDHARKIKKQIEDMLANGVYHVMDWEELNHPLFTALRIQQIGMSAVLALIILVAAFTVIATLIMIVLDKRKEIAVLKAMGARDSSILMAFVYQGGIIGAVGTALGLLGGYAMCRGLLFYGIPLDPKVYFISRLPVEMRPQEFLLTGLIALLICLAATIVPAMHAASIRPADGLRAQ